MVLVVHLEKQVGLLYGGNRSYCMGGKHRIFESIMKHYSSCNFSDTLENNTINVS
jgi:hypothetical protein